LQNVQINLTTICHIPDGAFLVQVSVWQLLH